MSQLEISRTEVQRRLGVDNPWWRAGIGIDREEAAWPRRAYFPHLCRRVVDTRVRLPVVLMGPRRVGKTVMLRHLVQRLLDDGEAGVRILYVSLDTPLYSGSGLESLVRLFLETQDHAPSDPLWVLFDEIQYRKDWEVHLESLVDMYPGIRFVACASATAALRMNSRESGMRRVTEFVLPPLTFAEYLRFTGEEEALIAGREADGHPSRFLARDIAALNVAFLDYLNFGGFPEAVMNEAVRANHSRFLRQDIIDKVLLKDLPSLYGISDTQELNRFFNLLAYNTGEELSLEALAKHSGITKQRVREYLEYLEATFLIRQVHRIDASALRLQRARTFKVYLTNPSLRAALFGFVGAEDGAMGRLAETAVWSQWLHDTTTSRSLHYARWKAGRQDLGVDIVSLDTQTQKPRFAVEIKWSDAVIERPGELRGLRELATRHQLSRRPLVATRSYAGVGELDGVSIEFAPVALHCYTIARNLLRVRD